MVIEMNEGKHVTLAQVREFLAGTTALAALPKPAIAAGRNNLMVILIDDRTTSACAGA